MSGHFIWSVWAVMTDGSEQNVGVIERTTPAYDHGMTAEDAMSEARAKLTHDGDFYLYAEHMFKASRFSRLRVNLEGASDLSAALPDDPDPDA